MSEVTPRDREEKLLAAIADGTAEELPTPRNRKEKLLKEIYDNGGGGGGSTSVTVDSELSTTSKNPVQNKVITQALNEKGTYSKPTGGIPKTDLASEVQASLENADNISTLATEVGEIDNRINNNTRRTRRNITSELANLPTAIAEQDLAKYGYAIGDYFVGASGYYYHLADMNTNYGGYNNYAIVNTKHCGIVVDTKSTCQWLSEGTVTNYSSSTLHAFLTDTALPNIKSDIATLFGDWESHLLTRTEIDNSVGGLGATWSGLKNCLICAMTEVQMYGYRLFGVDGYQTGTGSKALELFRKYRFNEIYGNVSIWLKSLFSESHACYANRDGRAVYGSVPSSYQASGLILFH